MMSNTRNTRRAVATNSSNQTFESKKRKINTKINQYLIFFFFFLQCTELNDINKKLKEAFEEIEKAKDAIIMSKDAIINTQKDELKMKDDEIKNLQDELKSAKEMVCGHAVAPNEEVFGPLCNDCGSAINKGIETIQR